MLSKKKKHPKVKAKLHIRNKHRERYDLKALAETCPELAPFVIQNKYGDESIDFADPNAVLMLNKALLKHFYKIENWSIPEGFLCPPIPGRADYIHHVADLLAKNNGGEIPRGDKVKCLDIGVGANCVYPLIGNHEYGWSFVGSEVHVPAIKSASNIVLANPHLEGKIELRLQPKTSNFFENIIQKDEQFDVSICNPPFYGSLGEAIANTQRKVNNLKNETVDEPVKNFGGQGKELWVKGGEVKFVRDMVLESKNFADSCKWFTTLISKHINLEPTYHVLDEVGATQVKTITMGQGHKVSRIVAWTFQPKAEEAIEKV